jgi:hypothetical protein
MPDAMSPDPEVTERERHLRYVHDEEHGEPEMCGADCIALGLVESAPTEEERQHDPQ